MEIRPYIMENPVMHYAWGSKGKNAFIPRLLNLSGWDKSTPWAELWMGAHPKAPSHIKTSHGKISLRDYINEQPNMALGSNVTKTYGNELPFLLKVLSASEILSIQAHPNKQQAEILHSRDPEHYPDDNHKPELAVALDNLSAFVGLKDEATLWATIKKAPELEGLVGKIDDVPDLPRKIFETLINTSIIEPEKIANIVRSLKRRLAGQKETLSFEESLFLETAEKYPEDDVGLLLIFILKTHFLKSSQGIFIHAGVPHAYIKGNIIECMANSDNVVRAGLTPKFKDAKTLLEIMDYSAEPLTYIPPENTRGLFAYRVPAKEFVIYRWKATRNEIFRPEKTNSPAILLLINGQTTIHWSKDRQLVVESGNSVFIPAALKNWNISANENSLMFLATVP